MEIECTQRLECTQELHNTQTDKSDPEEIGFLGICGAKYPVKRGPNKIGRDPACRIHLDLNSISRQHAVINVLSLSEIMLMDLDSSNKTKVQGKTLQPYIPHPLANGDMVQFGAIFGVFRLLEDDTDLPMTQAIDLPCTPSPVPKQMSRLGPPVLVPESPEVSDMDDSFVMPSQANKSTEFKSPMNKFIKPSNKTIAIKPIGSKTIDNAYWASTRKSDSFTFQLDDSGSSFNDSTISNKSNKVVEESNDNIHDMETQQAYKANDSTDSIYTANTQLPLEPSIHCMETQPPVFDIHMQETQQAPDIHALDTQIVPNTVHNCETQAPIIDNAIHNSETQAPIIDNAIHNSETQAPINNKLPEVRKLDDREDLQLDLFSANKENDNSVFNAEKKAILAEPKKSEHLNRNADESSKDKNVSDEEIMFDEINTQSFYGECESQPIIPAGNVSPQIERIEKIEVSSNKIRRESGSSTDCEDIDILPTQKISNDIDMLPTQKIIPDVKNNNDIDILPTQKIVNDIEMLPTQKIVNNDDDDDLTDCEDDCELVSKEIEESKGSPEIDFQDMATQIIGDDVIEAQINKNTDETDCPSKGVSFEELPTQLITDDCKEDNLEDMPTQIITDERLNREPIEEVYSEEMISPFKIPLATPLKAKKTPASGLTKPIPKVVVTKDDDEDDPNYYAATQDIFNDLCSQREPSPEAIKTDPSNENDELVPCSVEDYEMGDRFRHIDSDLSPVKKNNSVEKVNLEQNKDSSKANVLKTPKTLKIMNTDLPDSQEIKTSVTLKHKSMTESSDSETDDVSDQDCRIIIGKKRKPKVNAKQDLTKKFEESLPSRILTRVRKPTLKVRESDESNKTSKGILKNMILNDSDDSVDAEIINENISRLKSKTDKRKGKDDQSKRLSDESKKRPHSRNENKKNDKPIEETAKDHKGRSSRSKTKKPEETKSKADDQKESGDNKIRSTRSTRNKKDNDGKHHKSKKDKEQKDTKAHKEESKPITRSDSKSRTDSKSRSNSKSRNDSKTRSNTRNTSNEYKSKDTSKSKETKHNKSKTPETEVRRSSRQKSNNKEVTPKHENSTVYLSSESSTESPKNMKRPATSELEVPSPKRTRSLPSSKSSSISTTPASTSVCSTPVRVDTQYVLFTAFSNDDVRSKLEKLGAVLVTDVMSCTVLVTLQIKRTFKLLCAVGLGRPIVGPDWVQACADTNTVVDPWLYIMKDTAAERRFRFSLEKTLRGRRNFLKGYNVSATPSVLPTAQEMKLIVECSGGTWKPEGPNWICVTSSSDKPLWSALRRRGATLVSTEFILGGVLRQQADVASTAFGDAASKKKDTIASGGFVCRECGRVCLSRIGLASHARSHTRS